VLGELTCLTTAVVVMPAVLQLMRRPAYRPQPTFEWDQATAAARAAGSTEPAVPADSSSDAHQR
jgi:hypothetical protein